jgi:hypothetical protein
VGIPTFVLSTVIHYFERVIPTSRRYVRECAVVLSSCRPVVLEFNDIIIFVTIIVRIRVRVGDNVFFLPTTVSNVPIRYLTYLRRIIIAHT